MRAKALGAHTTIQIHDIASEIVEMIHEGKLAALIKGKAAYHVVVPIHQSAHILV